MLVELSEETVGAVRFARTVGWQPTSEAHAATLAAVHAVQHDIDATEHDDDRYFHYCATCGHRKPGHYDSCSVIKWRAPANDYSGGDI